MDLSGKVALVTGASRGIGEAIAHELARAGADVVIVARSTAAQPSRHFEGTIDETLERVRAFGAGALALQGDVSREEDVQAVHDATMAQFGRCDLLVNNAAASFLGPLLELSIKRWDIVMGVNLRGPMLLCKAFIPHMIEQGEGRIVNITSADGRLDLDSIAERAAAIGTRGDDAAFGQAGQDLSTSTLAYATSKAALNRFTVGLARELRDQRVAVNALEVNAVTPAYRLNLPDADFSMNEMPEAPAQLVTWLATQPVQYTGQILCQEDLLGDLRAKGVIRPKVDPA